MNDEMKVDFLPDGQLKWRCLEYAREVLGDVPRPFSGYRRPWEPAGYVVTDYNRPYTPPRVVDSAEVLALAQQIYGWVTGETEAITPSTDEDLRELYLEHFMKNTPMMAPSVMTRKVDQMVDFVRTGNPGFASGHNHTGAVPCEVGCRMYNVGQPITTRRLVEKAPVEVNGTTFDCQDTADRVYNLFGIRFGSAEVRSIIRLLGDAGITFGSTDTTQLNTIVSTEPRATGRLGIDFLDEFAFTDEQQVRNFLAEVNRRIKSNGHVTVGQLCRLLFGNGPWPDGGQYWNTRIPIPEYIVNRGTHWYARLPAPKLVRD